MNDFAAAPACIPNDCQPYIDVITSNRGKRKNGRYRRAVSRKYRQFAMEYKANNQGEIGVQYGSEIPTLVPSNGSMAAATNISMSDGVMLIRIGGLVIALRCSSEVTVVNLDP